MARKADSDAPPPNTANRDDLIKALDSDLRPLEAEMEEIRGRIREARQQFKADTGIPLADFDAARRYALMEDEDVRDEKLRNLRDCFNAMSPGGQLDWIADA